MRTSDARRWPVPVILVSLLLLVPHWGCMGACDLLVPTKRLPGPYSLVQFDGERYYVVKEGVKFGGGGVLQGSVGALGWNDRYIVGKRFAMRSDLRSGWMIIDVQTSEIKGPFTEDEFAEAVRQDSSLASIKIWPVAEAWKKLGWPPW